MAQRVVGIDIGSGSVKVVHLVVSMRSYSVAAYDEQALPAELDADGQTVPFPHSGYGE